jgi:hypothetical protein
MHLDPSRFFNDRLIFDPSSEGKLSVTNSFWDWCMRLISWIWSPASYTEENRRTVQCFKNYLIDTLGADRLQRICSRYSLNLEKIEKQGNPLLSRDVAKIVVGTRSVSVEDVNEFIQKNQQNPRYAGKSNFLDLDRDTLFEVQRVLSRSLPDWEVDPVCKNITGRPTEWLANFMYDPLLADRERLHLIEEHPRDPFETFVHNMTARVIKREMEVGTLIPAPNHPDGRKQFYYLSAKLVSGKGMVSYLFHPATADTNLPPIRFFRGTSPRNSEIDAISTLITDLESDLGRSAYESGEIYEPIIRQKLQVPTIEAGHSLGSTLVQYRLANMDHIQKAYLYCGPGVPEVEAEKFNQKNPPIELIIRTTERDLWHTLGEAHLGYQAPPNVNVDFLKYHAPITKYDQNPHVTVWNKEIYLYGIEGGMPPAIRDEYLHHKHGVLERIRSLIGPFFALLLNFIKETVRSLFDCRIHHELGLKIGSLQAGRWQVDHFRPIAYTPCL